MNFSTIGSMIFLALLSIGCSSADNKTQMIDLSADLTTDLPEYPQSGLDTITLGAGCFWCVEAVFQQIEGVTHVESGYTGGASKNPTYKEVCSGTSGHVEVAQVVFDRSKVSLAEILEIFWVSHDPTQLNRQGNDVGTQYRSVIFYNNELQRKTAEASLELVESSGLWKAPIVTTIEELGAYYKAEGYHQNYYADNTRQPYCSYVITPKVEKVRKLFKDKLKK